MDASRSGASQQSGAGLRKLVMPSKRVVLEGLDITHNGGQRLDQFGVWFRTRFGALIALGRVGRATQATKDLAVSMLVASLGEAGKHTRTNDPLDLLVAANRHLNSAEPLDCSVHLAIATWDLSHEIMTCAAAGDVQIWSGRRELCRPQPAMRFGALLEECPSSIEFGVRDTLELGRASGNPESNISLHVKRAIDL